MGACILPSPGLVLYLALHFVLASLHAEERLKLCPTYPSHPSPTPPTPSVCRELGHSVHLLRNSTHWVHASNPGGLFDILAPSFGSPPDLRMQRVAWEPPPPTTGLHL